MKGHKERAGTRSQRSGALFTFFAAIKKLHRNRVSARNFPFKFFAGFFSPIRQSRFSAIPPISAIDSLLFRTTNKGLLQNEQISAKIGKKAEIFYSLSLPRKNEQNNNSLPPGPKVFYLIGRLGINSPNQCVKTFIGLIFGQIRDRFKKSYFAKTDRIRITDI